MAFIDADKQKRIEIFEDTLKQIGKYDKLQNALNYSKNNTILYTEDEEISLPKNPNRAGKISVVNGRTFKTAKNFENVAVLNFASATNAGGAVVRGSNAQEECLCRCSTLYPCISDEKFFDIFYKYHRNKHNTMYTDRILYSKDIIVIKDDIREPVLLLEDNWYKVDVITCAAPNLIDVKNVNQNELLKLFKQRIRRIFSVAVKNEVSNIILGAFGCGAFKNPPNLVARAFKEVIPEFKGYFDNIVFACLVTPGQGGDNNFKTFQRVFPTNQN